MYDFGIGDFGRTVEGGLFFGLGGVLIFAIWRYSMWGRCGGRRVFVFELGFDLAIQRYAIWRYSIWWREEEERETRAQGVAIKWYI
ncbi:MAG: hypothetical protein EA364_09550 [Balneolaceae bacterium]|nr:MAG: hypothetical protein EA364_09550 [Balneolaceae bacterium]